MEAERDAGRESGGTHGVEGTTRGGGGRAATLTDEQLVAALRLGDTRVLEEFVARFQRLVFGQARRYRIPPSERRGWAIDLLHDVALTLMQPEAPLPRSIRGYLVRAAHHRWVDARRARIRRRIEEAIGAEPGDAAAEPVLRDGYSTYARQASQGPDWEDVPLSPVLERLISALDEGMSAEERRMLAWISQGVQHHEIARALGISRSGVSQRVRRLRARLYEMARRHTFDADPGERVELIRFLRRAAVYDVRAFATLESQRDSGHVHS